MIRVGIDTGGTFTDLVAVDEQGRLVTSKVLSQPRDPGQALLSALAEAGVNTADVTYLGVGTTVATNAVLESTGPRVLLVTTAGFRDIVFIGRLDKERLYDLNWVKPQPLVRREDVFEVRERIGADGVFTALDEEELARVVEEVVAAARDDPGCSVAVCTLFSFLDPQHERRLGDALREALPTHAVSVSHEVCPRWREFERASTTLADAYVKTLVSTFIDGVAAHANIQAATDEVAIVRSNGGRLNAQTAKSRPVELLLSGPAAGVIGLRYLTTAAELQNVITFDMGGTSTDIGVIRGGNPVFRDDFELAWGIPAAIPSVDVRTIGAGGGSIVWSDAGQLLRVGPNSAGSEPGPICYGRGGTDPTVTDANLVLGRLDADFFLGGRLALDVDAAASAFGAVVSRSSYEDESDVASAALEIACENMANAVRLVAVEKGLDLDDFVLAAFGGAGPLHATAVARSLGIPKVVVPLLPGQSSALGVLIADGRVDKSATVYSEVSTIEMSRVHNILASLQEDISQQLGPPATFRYAVTMRYSGQNYEREVELAGRPERSEDIQLAVQAFHASHREFYGFSSEGHAVEIVDLKVVGVVEGSRPTLPVLEVAASSQPKPIAIRRMYFRDTKWIDAPVYRRDTLRRGHRIVGPAVIEEEASTTLLHPGDTATIDLHGFIHIAIGTAASRPSRAASVTDSHTMTLLQNMLDNVADEMAMVMLRTSYSTIFNEGRDFSTVLADRDGNLIAEKNFTPSMIGAMPHTIKWAIEELGSDYFKPGDVIVHNDPYRGNCHLPEHMLMKPIFVDGELFGFAGVMGHISEIGGMAVGSFATEATDIYQEGLRLPPVKIISAGQHVDDVWRILLANHRTPRFSWGDLHAMIGSLNIAERRLLDIVDRYGARVVEHGTRALQDYSEDRMKAAISIIPDGDYASWMYLEDDGVDVDPVLFKVVIRVSGDHVIADWRGSASQTRGPINCTVVVTMAAVYNALFCVTDPLSDIPRNHGCYRPIHVIAPYGTVVNVAHPGSCVSGNTETQAKLIDLLLGALEPAAPSRVAAAAGGTPANFLFGGYHPTTREFFSVYHFDGAGSGATTLKDGNDGEITRHSNCRNTPVEVLESRYPWRVLEYALIPDSGGTGEHRGGLGIQSTFEALSEMTVSALFDRHFFPPWGLRGGGAGAPTRIEIRRNGQEEFMSFTEAAGTRSPTKFQNIAVSVGDRVRYQTPGGGGFGNPGARDVELVRHDVRSGRVSAEQARTSYGVDVEHGRRISTHGHVGGSDGSGHGIEHREEQGVTAEGAKITGRETSSNRGEWQDLNLNPWTTQQTACTCCGRLLLRRAWIEEGEERRVFCSPLCSSILRLFADVVELPHTAPPAGAHFGRRHVPRPERKSPPDPTEAIVSVLAPDQLGA